MRKNIIESPDFLLFPENKSVLIQAALQELALYKRADPECDITPEYIIKTVEKAFQNKDPVEYLETIKKMIIACKIIPNTPEMIKIAKSDEIRTSIFENTLKRLEYLRLSTEPERDLAAVSIATQRLQRGSALKANKIPYVTEAMLHVMDHISVSIKEIAIFLFFPDADQLGLEAFVAAHKTLKATQIDEARQHTISPSR